MSDGQTGPRRLRAGTGVRVGRVLGVPLIVQPSWFVIVVIVAATFKPAVQDRIPGLSDAAGYGVGLAFVLLLYGSVLVHEISHVAVAKALGMEVRRVVLQIFGGMSEVVEEQPGRPDRDYLVAVVGPMTSLLLGSVGLILIPAFDGGTVPRLLVGEFAVANLFVAAFNILPGLPLDGGRVLRAVLWRLSGDRGRGTVAAGWVGRGLAVAIMGVVVVKPDGWGESTAGAFYLVLLAVYMWASASVALAQAKVGAVLPTLDIRALSRRAFSVAPELPVAEAVRRAREAGARAIVVVDGNGHPSGLVSEAAVSALAPQRQPWVSVSDLARPLTDGLVLRNDMNGEAMVEAVQATPATEYLVLDRSGQVFGVLSRIDLTAALQAAGLR